MTANSDYFNTPVYLDYLKAHCGPGNVEAMGRVAGSEFAARIIGMLSIQPRQKVLEIGCGVGRILHLMRAMHSADVVGCDVSLPAIEHVRASDEILADKVHCSASDALDFLAPASVDHVVTWGVFELTDQRRTLLEISRVLKVGGKALLGSVKNRNYRPDDEDSQAAHRAYVAKSIPISFTDVENLEKLLRFLGFKIVQRVVFEYKKDLVAEKYEIDQGGIKAFAESMYIIEKSADTALNLPLNVHPSAQEVNA